MKAHRSSNRLESRQSFSFKGLSVRGYLQPKFTVLKDVYVRSWCVKKIQSIQPMKRFNNAFELHQIIWAIHQVYQTIIYKQIRQLYKRLIKQISCINVGNSENQSSIHSHIIDKSNTLDSLRFSHSRLLKRFCSIAWSSVSFPSSDSSARRAGIPSTSGTRAIRVL